MWQDALYELQRSLPQIEFVFGILNDHRVSVLKINVDINAYPLLRYPTLTSALRLPSKPVVVIQTRG